MGLLKLIFHDNPDTALAGILKSGDFMTTVFNKNNKQRKPYGT